MGVEMGRGPTEAVYLMVIDLGLVAQRRYNSGVAYSEEYSLLKHDHR